MQASELLQIVKDVPAQAGPDGLSLWTDVDKRCPDAWIVDSEIGVHQVSTHHAALMFEASMSRHLICKGFHSFEWDADSEEETVTLDLYGDVFIVKCCGELTHVAALAAACKEVSNG
jgi:hypothetical protein